MAIEREIILNVQTGEAAKSINDFRSNIKTLTKELNTLDAGSDGFNEVLKELASSQQSLNAINAEVAASIKGIDAAQNENATTVRELQAEINRYRDKLVTLDSSSNEYADTVQEITSREQKLTEVKSAGRKIVERQISDTAKLRNEIREYRDQLVTLERGSEDYVKVLRQVGDAQGRLNDIQDDARFSALTLGEQLGNLTKMGAQIAGGISSINAVIQLLGADSENLAAIMVRLQASIALVQGLQGLSGLTKTIPALITGIRTLTVGIGGLRSAIIGTGIGAFAVAIAAVVDNLGFFSSGSNTATEAINSTTEAIRIETEELEESEREWQRYIARRRALGAEELEIIERTKNRTLQQLNDLPEQAGKSLYQLEVEYNAALERINNTFYFWGTKRAADRRKLREQFEKDTQEAYKKAAEDRRELNNTINDLDFRAETERQKRQQKAVEDAQKRRGEDLKNVESILRQVEDAGKSSYDRELDNLTERYKNDLSLLEQYGKDTMALTTQYYADIENIVRQEDARLSNMRLQDFNNEIQQIRNANDLKLQENDIYLASLEEQLTAFQLKLEQEGGSSEEIEARIAETEQRIIEAMDVQSVANIEFLEEYRELLEGLLEDSTLIAEDRISIENELQNTLNSIELAGINSRKTILDNEIKNRQQNRKAADDILKAKLDQEKLYYSYSAQLLSAASGLLGQQTAAGKAFAIASATISTYAGAAQVLANPLNLNPIVKWANFATTIATGLGAVKNIASVSIPDVASTTAVNSPLISENIIAPEPDVSRIIPDINERTTDLQTTEERQLNNRVYVLESDISDTINRINIFEAKATL